MRAAPRVFLQSPQGSAAAPFGQSMFNAISKQQQQQQQQQSKSQSAIIIERKRHFDRMIVRMDEILFDDNTGSSSVVIGPDIVAVTKSNDDDDDDDAKNNRRSWSLPFARAAQNPTLLSTSCPTVFLEERGWYDNNSNKPLKEHVRLGVVAAVYDPDGRILLTRRASHMRSFPHAWVMPGGGLDEGESLVEALVREVKEETGVTVNSDTVAPFCLWESCYPTSGEECVEAGTGITAHYMVVFCLAALQQQQQQNIVLDETETDLAVWISADEFASTLDHPCGGIDIGSVLSSSASKSSSSEEEKLPLEQLCGIYPRGDEIKGIAQGNLFMLEELLRSKGGASFQ